MKLLLINKKTFCILVFSLICTGCGLSGPGKTKKGSVEKLKYAHDALLRIERFCEIEELKHTQNALKKSEMGTQVEVVRTTYDDKEAYKDYETIKLLSNEINSKESYEIQAKAAERILFSYTSYKDFDIPSLYLELETLAIQYKNSDVIKQCWIDGIQSICEFHFYNKQKGEIESMTNRSLKFMRDEYNGQFYEEAYAQILYCSLAEEFMQLFLNDNSSVAPQYLNDYLSKLSKLYNDVALKYEAKALRHFIFEFHADIDVATTVHYCDRVIEISSKYPDDFQMQEIQCESIEDTLSGLFWHPDADSEGDLFNKYYCKLEELSVKYQNLSKFDKLHEKVQRILGKEKRSMSTGGQGDLD